VTIQVVVPCYNEGHRWDSDYWRELVDLGGFRWIFVDDGSQDNTLDVATAVCSDTNSSVLSLGVNAGKSEAVRAGLLQAIKTSQPSDIVGFMDADGAFARYDIERLGDLFCEMRSASEPFDALWSSRVALAGRSIDRSASRHYMGRIAATFLSWRDPSVPYDTQSGFKLFKPSVEFSRTLQAPFQTRWLFEMEMLTRFQVENGRPMKVWEEPLLSWWDVPGSKVSAREVLRIGREILTVKKSSRKHLGDKTEIRGSSE